MFTVMTCVACGVKLDVTLIGANPMALDCQVCGSANVFFDKPLNLICAGCEKTVSVEKNQSILTVHRCKKGVSSRHWFPREVPDQHQENIEDKIPLSSDDDISKEKAKEKEQALDEPAEKVAEEKVVEEKKKVEEAPAEKKKPPKPSMTKEKTNKSDRPLEEMNTKELKAIASEIPGIERVGRMKKKTLLEVIKSFRKKQEDEK